MIEKDKMNIETQKHSNAFTLIELLVVIGVIALLVSILMPALGKAKATSRRAACRAQLHGLGQIVRMYLNDNNDFMPNAAQVPSEEPDLPSITETLMPYLDNKEAMHCPSDKIYFEKEGTSYEYPFVLRGKQVNRSFLGKKWGEADTPVLFDFGPFHNKPGKKGAINFLFGDGHVGDMMDK